MSMPTQTYTHSAGFREADATITCYEHKLPAARRTSRTLANPDRDFFCCSKQRDDPDRCKFFLWADDIAVQYTAPPPPPQSLSQASAVPPHPSPRHPQAQRAALGHSPSTSTPQKRPRSVSPGPRETTMTPAAKHQVSVNGITRQNQLSPSQKLTVAQKANRLANIAAGLDGSPSPQHAPARLADGAFLAATTATHGVTSPSPYMHPLPSLGQALLNARAGPSSQDTSDTAQSPVEDEDEEMFWRSFSPPAAAPSTPHRSPVAVPGTASEALSQEPSTRRPRTPQRASASTNGMLLTPPPTSQPESDFEMFSSAKNGSIDVPGTRARWKGKEREIQTTSRLNSIQLDPENPFHEGVASQPQEPSGSAMSADSFAAQLEGMSHGIIAHIRKLERRLAAAEKSSRAKANKIEEQKNKIKELENEIQRLKERQAA